MKWASSSVARPFVVGVLIALGGMLAASSSALADGGTTIAGETPIVYGQQEFGNTSNGAVSSNGVYDSYWGLSVTAGDAITIDWEGQLDQDGDGPGLFVYPVGTTDYNVDDTESAQSQYLNSNARNELTFTVPRTGVMPAAFESDACCDEGSPGPYDFTATVKHAVLLAVPVLPRLTSTGEVSIGVHNPDGVGLSGPPLVVYLQLRPANQAWTNIGDAAPSAGTAVVPYSIPRTLLGEEVRIRAVAAGSGYQTDASSSQQTSVVAPPAPACVVPALKGLTLAQARAALTEGHCRLGRVTHRRAPHKRRRVVAQSPRAGGRRQNGTRVNVVLGR